MAITTYDELKTAISSWLSRGTDLDSNVDDFIDLAEAYIQRKLRIFKQETTSAFVTVSGTSTISLPTDFRRIIELRLDDDPAPLSFTTQKQLTDTRAGIITGRPKQWAFFPGDLILLGPTPNAVFNGTISYFAQLPALSDSQTTNVILTKAADLYLYASLVEASEFIDDEPRVVKWTRKRDGIIFDMNVENQGDTYAFGRALTDTGNP